MPVPISLVVTGLTSGALSFEDCAFVSINDMSRLTGTMNLKDRLCSVKSHIILVRALVGIPDGSIALGQLHRSFLQTALDESVDVVLYEGAVPVLGLVEFEITNVLEASGPTVLEMKECGPQWKNGYNGHPFCLGQTAAFIVHRHKICCRVARIEMQDESSGTTGIVAKGITLVSFVKGPKVHATILGSELTAPKKIFDKGFHFSTIGVGGLDAQLMEIFRRAFASRLLPPTLVDKLGLKHVRGMLLYGAPGCGKTLIARQLGKALNAREPKIVNGPEILNKYVGQSEENIRNLFADAEADFRDRGLNADLHIIIFDEIDAICKRRGTVQSGTGVNDSVVNQLLSKLDGVEELNNILVIGMTNRIDMIDEALLRPGRLEVHVEIGLPDESGRLNILQIHTKKIADAKMLADDVSLEEVAKETKNFTGAELEGVVREARNFATGRLVDPTDLGKPVKAEGFSLTQEDFDRAVKQAQPMFGVREESLAAFFPNGIVHHGPKFAKVYSTLEKLVNQVRTSKRTHILSVCLCGQSGSGKTALSAKIAQESRFPFAKRMGPDTLVGLPELEKAREIRELFDDAYRSELSVIVLDDLEKLFEFIGVGPRFSNTVLQAILVLAKKRPPHGHKLLVVATAQDKRMLRSLGCLESFDVVVDMPLIESKESYEHILTSVASMEMDEMDRVSQMLCDKRVAIGVKKLINAVEMAATDRHGTLVDAMVEMGLVSLE